MAVTVGVSVKVALGVALGWTAWVRRRAVGVMLVDAGAGAQAVRINRALKTSDRRRLFLMGCSLH